MKKRLRKKFLEELRTVPIIQVSCVKVGLTRQTVYRWRGEDLEFAIEMDKALDEGFGVINDLSESKLISLVQKEVLSAIKYWLEHHHDRYKKDKISQSEKRWKMEQAMEVEAVMKELDLTSEDFTNENIESTRKRIYEHVTKYD